MRSLSFAIVLTAFAGATAFLLYETWRLAELAGRHEVVAREARAALAAAEWSAGRQQERLRAAQAEVVRLDADMARTTAQLSAMAETVAKATATAEQRVAAAQAADAAALAPMPQGVRDCLRALHTCFAIEGFNSPRFLRARALDDDGLHDVELVHTHEDGLAADLLVAGTMTANFDRAIGRLSLLFFDGSRTVAGVSTALPPAGYPLVFEGVDGRLLEERLPFLVKASGVYAETEPARAALLPTDVDMATRLCWLERLDRLLEQAGTKEKIRMQRFRGMAKGAFLEAQLLGTDALGHVLFGAACSQLSVEVDRTANIVSLLMRDGTLRRGEAMSTITAEGYRMLLPDVRPEQAIETMLGFVVTR